MSRYIAKYMNLEKSKRLTFWNGWSTYYFVFYNLMLSASIDAPLDTLWHANCVIFYFLFNTLVLTFISNSIPSNLLKY